MKKNTLVFGLISGLIVSVVMIFGMASLVDTSDFDNSMVLGFTSMLVAFSFVFVGIKNYRDKYNMGVISFGSALKTGFWITLIASTMYVITWAVYYHYFIPDFFDKYGAYMLEKAKAAGATAAEIDKQVAEMDSYREMYKNPLLFVLLTYMEILPVGLIISLISALILKRKEKS